jgi:hypothetical protein
VPGSLVFPRGSHVLEYWLAHAEGFTVRSRGPVERVIVEPLYGRATALVIRAGFFRRRQVVSAAEVAAVDPEARVLELDERPRPPREPSQAAARVRSASAWLAARVRHAAREGWAAALTLLAAAVEAGRTLFERAVRWYEQRDDAPYLYPRRPQRRPRPRVRVAPPSGAGAGRGVAGARARRPRGAVGRHLRP